MAPGEAFCPFNRRQRSQRQTGWCRRQKSAGESGGRPVLQILSSPVAQMECSGLALSTATMAQTIDAGAVGLERRSGLQVLGWTAGQMVDGWMGRQGKVRYGTPAGGWTGVGAGDQVNDGERALLGQGRGSAGGVSGGPEADGWMDGPRQGWRLPHWLNGPPGHLGHLLVCAPVSVDGLVPLTRLDGGAHSHGRHDRVLNVVTTYVASTSGKAVFTLPNLATATLGAEQEGQQPLAQRALYLAHASRPMVSRLPPVTIGPLPRLARLASSSRIHRIRALHKEATITSCRGTRLEPGLRGHQQPAAPQPSPAQPSTSPAGRRRRQDGGHLDGTEKNHNCLTNGCGSRAMQAGHLLIELRQGEKEWLPGTCQRIPRQVTRTARGRCHGRLPAHTHLVQTHVHAASSPNVPSCHGRPPPVLLLVRRGVALDQWTQIASTASRPRETAPIQRSRSWAPPEPRSSDARLRWCPTAADAPASPPDVPSVYLKAASIGARQADSICVRVASSRATNDPCHDILSS
ncbi:hypothetical protein Purlil1_1771 [Purpureocillium lilacinum]|uniref:Uncharacterized protein n=1 Tax=Purpureocillium lilacinum TaxID=33203 RepID=A0ABR0CDR7_PURLI|nr:hypothetical protein Purlil1_1771 [Purpureocillium lilacinum]